MMDSITKAVHSVSTRMENAINERNLYEMNSIEWHKINREITAYELVLSDLMHIKDGEKENV